MAKRGYVLLLTVVVFLLLGPINVYAATYVEGFSFAAKIVWPLVLVIAGILVIVEVMHFMHRKIPPNMRLKLPSIPPLPMIPQQK